MLILAPDTPCSREARAFRQDERNLVSTLVSVDLVEAERGARHHGPPRRVVGQGLRATHQVHSGVVQLNGVQGVGSGLADEGAEVGRGAVVQAFTAPPVVGGEYHDGVLPLPHLLQARPEPS